MEKVAEDITLIEESSVMGIPFANTYIIGKPGDYAMIDPGNPDGLLWKIRLAEIDPEDIRRIVLTHAHFDHCFALEEIAKQVQPDLYIHKGFIQEFEAQDQYLFFCMDEWISMAKGMGFEAPKYRVSGGLEDQQEITLGDRVWQVHYMPGHSPDNLVLYDPERKILVSGDLIFADSVGRDDFALSNHFHHIASLAKVTEMDVEMLLPGHGGIIEDSANSAIKRVVYWYKDEL